MSKASDRAEFVAVLTQEFGISTWKAERMSADLIRTNAELGRINERNCNEDMSDERRERMDRRESLLERHVEKIAAEINTSIQIQGDPRGPALKVVLPSGRSNSWGGVGFCVP